MMSPFANTFTRLVLFSLMIKPANYADVFQILLLLRLPALLRILLYWGGAALDRKTWVTSCIAHNQTFISDKCTIQDLTPCFVVDSEDRLDSPCFFPPIPMWRGFHDFVVNVVNQFLVSFSYFFKCGRSF